MNKNTNIGFVILGPPILGGAEKRYATAFNYLNNKSDNYFLLINESRYRLLNEIKIFTTTKNIKIIKINSDKKQINYSENIKSLGGLKIRNNYFRKILSFIKNHIIFLNTFLRIEKWRRLNKINIIYGIFQGAFYIIPYYFQKKIKTIISYNDSQFNLLDNKGFDWFQGFRIPLKRASQLDLLSEFILEGIEKRGYDLKRERVNVAPCSFINYSKYHPSYPKENLIVFSGRLFEYKNPILFIEGAREVLKIRKDYKFIILGKGRLQNEINQIINTWGITEYMKVSYESEPGKILSKSKIFVSLQETNNYPSQSLLEAIACENAVIATDVGETRKIVTKETGILIGQNIFELKNAIIFLIENETVRNMMTLKAKNKILHEHNLEIYSVYLNSIFNKLL